METEDEDVKTNLEAIQEHNHKILSKTSLLKMAHNEFKWFL